MSPRRILSVVAAVLVVLAAFVGGVVVGGHARPGLTRLSDPLRSILLGDSGRTSAPRCSRCSRTTTTSRSTPRGSSARRSRNHRRAGRPVHRLPRPRGAEALRQRNEGEYYGVGLQVAQRGEQIVITRVFEESPPPRPASGPATGSCRWRAPPWRGGCSTRWWRRIRGPKGSTVRLGIASPGGATRRYELERERIRVPAVDSRVETARGEKVGYLRLAQFTKGRPTRSPTPSRRCARRASRRWCSTCAETPAAS